MKNLARLLSILFLAVPALGLAMPAQATVTPEQAFFLSNGQPGYVTPYNLTTGVFGSQIPVGSDPEQVILSPDESTAYVLNYDSSTISVIDTATDTVSKTFDLKGEGLYYPYPYAGVISPDGKTLYITDGDYDAYAINAQTGALEATYGLGGSVYPYNLAIGSTGGHVYVTEYEGGDGAGGLGIINTQTGTVTTLALANLALPAGSPSNVSFEYPYPGIVVSGDTVWLSGYPYDSSTRTYGTGVVAIDVATGQVTQFDEFEADYSAFGPGNLYLDPLGSWLYMPTDNSSYGAVALNTQTGAFQLLSTVPYAYEAAFAQGGGELYLASYAGSGAGDVIDTNPQSAQFNQVVSTLSGVPAEVDSIVADLGPFYSKDTGILINAPAGPYTGSVAGYVQNSTGCTPVYKVTTEPASGDFALSPATGGYTLTPPVGDLSASESFYWEATLPATCTADPNGVAAGGVTLQWTPAFGAIGPFTLTSGQSSGTVSFEVFSAQPVTLTATSSNPAVVPPGLIDLSSGCQGTCTLNLTTGVAGTSTVTLTATEASGATGSTTFSVAVSPAPTTGGGGGFGPWVLLGLLAFVFLKRRTVTA